MTVRVTSACQRRLTSAKTGERTAIDDDERYATVRFRVPFNPPNKPLIWADLPAVCRPLDVANGHLAPHLLIEDLEQVPHLRLDVAEHGESVSAVGRKRTLHRLQFVP